MTNISFYKRFWLELTLDEARKKFVNRINISVFDKLEDNTSYDEIFRKVCENLWEDPELHKTPESRYDPYSNKYKNFKFLTRNDFNKTKHVLEFIPYYSSDINSCINKSIEVDWVDLWITFVNGKFFPKGDVKLDHVILGKSLDNLEWYFAKKYYDECLENYLKWNKKWVIEDCFETLEKLAQEILENDKGLKENKKDLINYLKGSEIFTSYWVRIIETLYDYYNDHRHTKNGKINENIDESEAVATLYLTGVIINLITKKSHPK